MIIHTFYYERENSHLFRYLMWYMSVLKLDILLWILLAMLSIHLWNIKVLFIIFLLRKPDKHFYELKNKVKMMPGSFHFSCKQNGCFTNETNYPSKTSLLLEFLRSLRKLVNQKCTTKPQAFEKCTYDLVFAQNKVRGGRRVNLAWKCS